MDKENIDDIQKIISYERLLKIARKMHLWIFLRSFDEETIYDELGLTPEENAVLGYSGKFEFTVEKNKGNNNENNIK